jgi:segregation and condensation protein B
MGENLAVQSEKPEPVNGKARPGVLVETVVAGTEVALVADVAQLGDLEDPTVVAQVAAAADAVVTGADTGPGEDAGIVASHAEGAVGDDEATAGTLTEPEAVGEDPERDTGVDEETARLAGIVESMLLASGAPVPLARLVDALGGPGRREVVTALRALGALYEREGRGLRLVFVAGGYQLRSAPEHAHWVRRLMGGRPPRLSRPMLETLAIVAYRQPVTRPEIEAIRGVDADAVLSTLLERRLVKIQGRKDAPGRPILYATTKDFLEVFALPDLQALPPLAELGDGAEALIARAEQAGEAAAAESSAAAADPDGGEPAVAPDGAESVAPESGG